MQILFTTQPFPGHYHPLMPFALALKDAGHEVAFAGAGAFPDFRSAIEADGFRYFPAGEFRRLPEIMAEIKRERPDADESEQVELRFQKIFLGQSALTMTRDLLALVESGWKPDLIVREPAEFGGCIVGEHFGIPHATAGAPNLWPPDYWARIADNPLAEILRETGIDGHIDASSFYRYLDLVAFPPSFIMAEDYLHPTSLLVHPTPFDWSGGDESLPDWLADLPDRPTVHGTLGTTNWSRTPGAFEALAGGVAGQPYDVILTVGRDRDPAEIDPHASNVVVERYIPHSLLLPHCDAVICHGGLGTTLATLMGGLPLVVMPLGADQFRNAERVRQIGAGIVIDPDERTPGRVREAVQAILDDSSYRENAERFREEVRALPGLDYAVELLERLARVRQPILRSTDDEPQIEWLERR